MIRTTRPRPPTPTTAATTTSDRDRVAAAKPQVRDSDDDDHGSPQAAGTEGAGATGDSPLQKSMRKFFRRDNTGDSSPDDTEAQRPRRYVNNKKLNNNANSTFPPASRLRSRPHPRSAKSSWVCSRLRSDPATRPPLSVRWPAPVAIVKASPPNGARRPASRLRGRLPLGDIFSSSLFPLTESPWVLPFHPFPKLSPYPHFP